MIKVEIRTFHLSYLETQTQTRTHFIQTNQPNNLSETRCLQTDLSTTVTVTVTDNFRDDLLRPSLKFQTDSDTDSDSDNIYYASQKFIELLPKYFQKIKIKPLFHHLVLVVDTRTNTSRLALSPGSPHSTSSSPCASRRYTHQHITPSSESWLPTQHLIITLC